MKKAPKYLKIQVKRVGQSKIISLDLGQSKIISLDPVTAMKLAGFLVEAATDAQVFIEAQAARKQRPNLLEAPPHD